MSMWWQRSVPNGGARDWPSSFVLLGLRRTWSFHVLDLRRTAGKCAEICDLRAQLLFCSLLVNLLSGGVLVAVVVAVFRSSLISIS